MDILHIAAQVDHIEQLRLARKKVLPLEASDLTGISRSYSCKLAITEIQIKNPAHGK